MTDIEKIESEMTKLNAERDAIVAKLRELSAKRAELQSHATLLALPPSPRKAAILAAAGIKSEEAVMTEKTKR